MTKLDKELDKLAAENPDVAAAEKNLEQTSHKIVEVSKRDQLTTAAMLFAEAEVAYNELTPEQQTSTDGKDRVAGAKRGQLQMARRDLERAAREFARWIE